MVHLSYFRTTHTNFRTTYIFQNNTYKFKVKSQNASSKTIKKLLILFITDIKAKDTQIPLLNNLHLSINITLFLVLFLVLLRSKSFFKPLPLHFYFVYENKVNLFFFLLIIGPYKVHGIFNLKNKIKVYTNHHICR